MKLSSGEGDERKKKRRQKIVDFFRGRKQKNDGEAKSSRIAIPSQGSLRTSRVPAATPPIQPDSSINVVRTSGELSQQQVSQPHSIRTPSPPEAVNDIPVKLDEDQLHALFSGAPQFGLAHVYGCGEPLVSFPWDQGKELSVEDASDVMPLAHPAFSAATARPHASVVQEELGGNGGFHQTGCGMGVFEIPSMLSAQGIEPGSFGFHYFLQLPVSDNFVTDLQQSESSSGFLEAVRNRQLMQDNPERLGIRLVDMIMVYERLAEFGDLLEAFEDSPEKMTILNNQSAGELYANLFGKFLAPPRYDSTTADPTGLKVQIDTLLRILRLKGVWFDFSLVEWRIRLGQVLWSEPDTGFEQEALSESRLWSDRDILLLQILLSCELLLRIDAVSSMHQELRTKLGVSVEEFSSTAALATRKTNWDLVLARRFLDNILVVTESHHVPPAPIAKPRGFLSYLSREEEEEKTLSKPDVVLLPRYQLRQLSGLLHFAEAVQWPDINSIVADLSEKLGVSDKTKSNGNHPSSFLEPPTPSSISVYGTPLPTPRSVDTIRSNYFGNITKPTLNRMHTSQTLEVPLSSSSLALAADGASEPLNIGGWLSRTYWTGLILPGEAISHFLISTLLENDKSAIAALGDSANLYGGFVYRGRSWWSKSSAVGRVLACLEGAGECMGWISVPGLPEGCVDGWYVVKSEQLPADTFRISGPEDIVARDSAVIPGGLTDDIHPADFKFALDPQEPPISSLEFTGWTLIPTSPEEYDDGSSNLSGEVESCRATLMFTSVAPSTAAYTLTLSNDVYFITSFPCTPPVSPSALKPQSLPWPAPLSRPVTITRSSSKHSTQSACSYKSAIPIRRQPSRRNSYGYEPLLSHPPDSSGQAPTRLRSPLLDEDHEKSEATTAKPFATNPLDGMNNTNETPSHPLHTSYKYAIVQLAEILDPGFKPSFRHSIFNLDTPRSEDENELEKGDDRNEVLVLDARGNGSLELLARAWCAERGLHALIGRVGRTCLGCCIREAKGCGVGVVIRV
ncbi:hypothetical protein GQ43DRAFT_380942 [Delitschia confertaspora ATCC 74209]|uniref:Uncharacterized protein n=1 Tax=Delitschia confertaspora ATCC 74209 TaxID=1513339 RepID=A0A9P4JE56_9PLEO|nr:hypothetical protein GQ43DRAFT_380942 [Delitschia confertaspora ATCC 74209]